MKDCAKHFSLYSETGNHYTGNGHNKSGVITHILTKWLWYTEAKRGQGGIVEEGITKNWLQMISYLSVWWGLWPYWYHKRWYKMIRVNLYFSDLYKGRDRESLQYLNIRWVVGFIYLTVDGTTEINQHEECKLEICVCLMSHMENLSSITDT